MAILVKAQFSIKLIIVAFYLQLFIYFRHTQTKRLKSSGSSAMSAEETNGLESGGENDSGDQSFYNRPSSCHHSWHGTINFYNNH